MACPDAPGLSYPIGSLWEACSVREVLSQHLGVSADFLWLHIRARLGDVIVVSDVHPLHKTALHTIACPALPRLSDPSPLFGYALTALHHEAHQAARIRTAPR